MTSTASRGVARPTLYLVPLGLAMTFAAVSFGVIHGPSAIAWLALLGALATIGSAAIMGRLDVAAAILVIVASFTGLLAVISDSPVSSYPSNLGLAVFALACLCADLRSARFRALITVSSITALILLAAVAAPSLSVGSYQARQVAIPIVLIYCGTVLARQRTSIRYITSAVLFCGAVNLVYMVPEYIHGPLLSPLNAYRFNSQSSVTSYDGVLPGNYTFYGSTSSHLRLGGLLFNPPVTGIFMALCGIVAFWTIRRRRLAILVSLTFLLAVLGTYARAGVLLYLLGISLPWLTARVGRSLSAGAMALVLALAAPVVAAQGGSVAHSEGLLIALERTLAHPARIGFGHFGNATHIFNTGGESLLGVFLVGTGALGIVIAAIAIWTYLRLVSGTNWQAGVGVAALLVAALSESASSLTGTACLWLVVGAALAVPATHLVPEPAGTTT